MLSFLPAQIPAIWEALVLVSAFALLCAKPLREHPLPFYLLFAAATVLSFWEPVSSNEVLYEIDQVFASCYTGVAFYLVVMFAGAFNRKHGWVKRLLGVRSELSIIGGIVVFGHVLRVAFMPYMAIAMAPQWQDAWGFAAPVMFLAGVVIGLPLLVCFLIPWVTSFKTVRRRMDARTWKRVQKLAYPFMALLVLQGFFLGLGHAVAVFLTPGGSAAFIRYALTMLTYLVIGNWYLILKLVRRSQKNRRLAEAQAPGAAEEGTAARDGSVAEERSEGNPDENTVLH